ncbi:bacterio-opsin activator [Sulfolobus sp. D5]|nr:bacterio-opsin activator [Sulfolobus sp. D5]
MRNFTNFPLKFVRVIVIHENCWSRYYSNEDLVRIINITPYPEKNILRVFATVSEKGYKEISKLKFEERIKDIFNVYRYGDKIFIDLARDYDNSVFSVISHNNGILLNTMKYNGMEIWNLLLYECKINKVLRELAEVADIRNVTIKDDLPQNSLKDDELKILSLAYEMGYFDYPRKVKSKELAEMLGIRESTLIYHLRKIEKKMVESLLRRHETV